MKDQKNSITRTALLFLAAFGVVGVFYYRELILNVVAPNIDSHKLLSEAKKDIEIVEGKIVDDEQNNFKTVEGEVVKQPSEEQTTQNVPDVEPLSDEEEEK